MKTKLAGVLFAALLAGPMAANAGLLGSTINLTWYYPDTSTLYCDNGNAVVGAGVEYPSGCAGFSSVAVDFDDLGFSVTHANQAGWSPASFNGFVVDVLTGIDFASVVYAGGTMGVTSVQVIGGDLFVNFAAQGYGTANFRFTQAAQAPEPGSLALLGLGLAGLAVARRRKQ